MKPGSQPVIYVQERILPEAWQAAMIALWERGCLVKTAFDRPGDPPSKDATVIVVIEEPLAEPRIHKKGFPGGLEDLEIYRLEVVAGVHDQWVTRFGTEWNYTYHERMFAYDAGDGRKINQWANMIEAIVGGKRHLSARRFQITTWIPGADPFIDDPPCLQRLHFRLLPDEEGWALNLNTDWRSRDGYKAWFMNVYAMTDLQRLAALELQERLGQPVKVGRYCDKSDSLHIYGKDFSGVGGFEGFLESIKDKPFEELAWATEFAQPFFVEARRKLCAQLDAERKGLGRGVVAPGVDWQSFPYPPEWDR
jgi:thymidylate synthase